MSDSPASTHTSTSPRSAFFRTLRTLDAFFDRIHIRPLGLIIFVLSAWGLWAMYSDQASTLKAQAVAGAERVIHASHAEAIVAKAHVKVGDMVERGQLLVTLSAPLIEHEIALADAEILQYEGELEVALAELERDHALLTRDLSRDARDAASDLLSARIERDQAARDLAIAQGKLTAQQRLRRTANATLAQRQAQLQQRLISDADRAEAELFLEQVLAEEAAALSERDAARTFAASLTPPQAPPLPDDLPSIDRLRALTIAAYQAQIALVRTRKANFQRDLLDLTITAQASGRVSLILPKGTAVTPDFPVVEILPPWATEAVAYLDPSAHPAAFAPGQPVRIASPHCPEQGASISHTGASVILAPGQLMSWTGKPLYGLPIHITLPQNCRLGVGQVVEVFLSPAPKPLADL